MNQKSVPLILVIIISLGFFGILGVLAFHSVPPENKDALESMLGVLGTAFIGLVGYYFGASVKDTPPAAAAPVIAAPPAPTPEQGA